MDKLNSFNWLFYWAIAAIIIARVISFLIGGGRTHARLRLMSLGIILTVCAALLGVFANAKISEAYLQFIQNAVVSRSAGSN